MSALREALDRVSSVCPLPKAAARVMALTAEPDVDLETIIEALSSDAALASEVMRIANSAAYGQSGRVNTLERAVLTIGLRELRDMATAMALISAFCSKEELSLELHSTTVISACICRDLSQVFTGIEPSNAFLCGLLSQIGAMACLSVDQGEYYQIWRDASEDEIVREQFEKERYGVSSWEIGAGLLRRNGLPEAMAEAVGASPLDQTVSTLARLTRISRITSRAMFLASKEGEREVFLGVVESCILGNGVKLSVEQVTEACIKAGGTAYANLQASLHPNT